MTDLFRDVLAISPEIVLLLYAIVFIILEPLFKKGAKKLIYYFSLVSLLISGYGVVNLINNPVDSLTIFGGMLIIDNFSLFFKMTFLIAGFLTVLASENYLDDLSIKNREYYPLLLISISGLMLLVSCRNLLTIWIALETAVLPLFVLTGYIREKKRSGEAAFKYFLLAAFSSAVFVYGVSLIYGSTGVISLEGISQNISEQLVQSPMFTLGMILMAIAIAFEIAAVPFHTWAPDTFEGAPTPIAAFLSTAPKAAAFAIFIRIFFEGFGALRPHWNILLIIFSIASMTLGNITAVLQDNIKRMLAYSSIAHAGYLFLGFIAGDEFGIKAVVLYVLIYTFMNIGAFNILLLVQNTRGKTAETLDDIAGLAQKNHLAAFSMLIFMLALTGIPFTSGFVGKLLLFGAVIKSGYGWLAAIAVINSVISLFYYMRVVVFMYIKEDKDEGRLRFSPSLVTSLAISVLFTILIGLYIEPFNIWASISVLSL